MEAQEAVGRSHRAINRLHRAANLVKLGVRMMHPSAAETHDSSSMAATQRQVALDEGEYASSDQVGGAWAEMVGAFFERHKDVAKLFDEFKAAYISDKGQDYGAWQPLASRFAALEYRVTRIHAKIDGKDTPQILTGHSTNKVVVDEQPPGMPNDANASDMSGSADAVQASAGTGSGVAPLPMASIAGLRPTEGLDETTNAAATESPLSAMIEKLLRNQQTIARLAGSDVG